MKVVTRQRHRGVESQDREAPGDGDDLVDHRGTGLGTGVVELRGVVPRHRRPVVAMVEVARLARAAVDSLEDHCRVRAIAVTVLDTQGDTRVGRQVRAREAVRRER